MSFKSEPIFNQIKDTLANSGSTKDLVKKTNSIIVFNLKNKEGKTKAWKLDLKNKGELTESSDFNDADLVISIGDLDFKKLVNGKSNSQKLFLSGKLKVKGDVMKAANIETILKKVAPAKAKL
ncbi:CYFA0S01e01530g1_1 [Cyberlindnera fabianii]|uniref:CYFA0S01e01530g1_1 n=1 Tax=Cyberlindnera fabianii TaxID=36022 RepID=A0A061AG02_CYBFA|nr:CYFA0S01e01530g1_1 [Cyberlindnera fabianii]